LGNVRRLLFLLAAAGALANQAWADSWTQPTPEELKMTAEPAAPGAAAIYLYRDERADDKLHEHTLYVRLKVLTDKGKDYADVEIPYEGRQFSIRAVEGRTIHSDGTVIPFTGKPYDKTLEKTKTEKYKAKVFTLPDVQVGSILEYRYVLAYDDNLVDAPQWYIQLPLYVRRGKYQFIPSAHELLDAHGNGMPASVAYASLLPKGAAVQFSQTQDTYSLDVEKIDPAPEEEYMPPMRSVTFRVLFYYTIARSADDYWRTEGKYWSKETDKFIDAGKLGGVVGQMVAASDTPRQKVEKIYAEVMKLENTSFTRGRSGAEDKAEGIKIKNASDIWAVKRGNGDEITLLFVGLVRAAGLKAWVAAVTNRDRAIFIPSYLYLGQLDDDIAIVELDGKDEFFDPGQRYCPFGQLEWTHTITQGLRQTEHGTEIVTTAAPGYKTNAMLRTADLRLDPDGKVHGSIRITMTGSEALRWRQLALRTDEEEIKREFENSVQRDVPPGVEVKTHHFLSLAEYDKALMAVLDVSGSMGTATSKRVFLPATFFEAGSKPVFVHDKRTLPVDLDYSYAVRDTVVVHLPPSFALESVPKDADIPLPKNAVYQATFKQSEGKLEATRLFVLANSLYTAAEYPALKEFYQKVNAKDQEQAILEAAPAQPDRPQTNGSTTAGSGAR
jgi:hypothetical protein